MLCLLINGARVGKYTWTPPSSSFSCLSTAWRGLMGRISFPSPLRKRLSHKNIVVHHENISNTLPSVMCILIYPSSSVQAGEEEQKEKRRQKKMGRQ